MKRNNEFRARVKCVSRKNNVRRKPCIEKEKSNQENKEKKIAIKITSLLASGLVVFSVARPLIEYIDSKNVVSLDEALKYGETTLEELGITEEIKDELDYIKETLKKVKDLSNSQLQELAIRINKLQGKVLRSKVADAFNVNPEEVRTRIRYDNTKQVDIIGEQENEEYKSFDVDENFEIYIYYEDFFKDLVKSMPYKDFDRLEIKSRLEEITTRIDEFAAGKIIISNEGELIWKGTRQSEIEKKKEQEREDDNVR